MGTVINFNQARKKLAKDQARQEKEKKAAENRAKYGRRKSDKQKSEKDQQIIQSHLDNHKIEETTDDEES